jgi:murein tripeptide amidase MpaA
MTLAISSRFDAGAIEVLACGEAQAIRLRVRPDSHADFAQWFYFCLTGAAGQRCRMTFENAGACAFPEGWRDYRAVASYDRRNWFRVPTAYDGAQLVIDHTPEHDSIYYAYFEPYSEERHADFLGALQLAGAAAPGRPAAQAAVALTEIGRSVEGRPLTLLTVTAPTLATSSLPGPKKLVWVIARQHPGETMAEWLVEGMLQRLVGSGTWCGDPVARQALAGAIFHIVPNMNPDGSAAGNLRTNAAGANLNREWAAPDAARSPEVLAVRNAIDATGCDMFFDIHGDEALPYVFVAGSEMLPDFSPRQAREQAAFIETFKSASPDFQDEHGYAAGKYREDALTLASKQIGQRFGCLSLTLEMPFKDNANGPDPVVGWNGARSAALGAALLHAIQRHLAAFA